MDTPTKSHDYAESFRGIQHEMRKVFSVAKEASKIRIEGFRADVERRRKQEKVGQPRLGNDVAACVSALAGTRRRRRIDYLLEGGVIKLGNAHRQDILNLLKFEEEIANMLVKRAVDECVRSMAELVEVARKLAIEAVKDGKFSPPGFLGAQIRIERLAAWSEFETLLRPNNLALLNIEDEITDAWNPIRETIGALGVLVELSVAEKRPHSSGRVGRTRKWTMASAQAEVDEWNKAHEEGETWDSYERTKEMKSAKRWLRDQKKIKRDAIKAAKRAAE